jgi:hypothetical protein
MGSRNHLKGSSHLILLTIVAMLVISTLLGWVLWKNLNHNPEGTNSSDMTARDEKQKVIVFTSEFVDWGVQLPLPSDASDFVTDSYSFTGNTETGSYGISLKGGSGCLATPDYVATIARVKSDSVVTKPESPLVNTSFTDGHYGETWSQLYHKKLEENKSGTGLVKAVKDIEGYTFVLQYLPSKCAAPDSFTDEGKKINKLRDDSASELKGYFNNLESSAQKRT